MTRNKFDLSHVDLFKKSGLSLAAYSRAENVRASVLQYHLTKEKRSIAGAANFVCVATPVKEHWLDLQIGSTGLRVRFNVDFTL